MKIKDIETIWLHVPFHEVPQRAMERNCHGWHISEICRVTADNGLVGVGETLPNYTWGGVSKSAIERAKGANPFEIMWDDSLGAGLQMAIFDLAGKAAGVPVYRLLGTKVRSRCPISWWGIDMPPQDYAAEARVAVGQGYTSFKQKARPWFDVFEQARLTAAEVDVNFKLDFDFNGSLNNAANALSILAELDSIPQMWIYESPIPQGDVAGNQRIRARTRCGLAMHYGEPPIATAVREQVNDGWVIGGGVGQILREARVCEQLNMPFWLQMVGTAWTTTLAAHLGAVCRMAQWPAVTCLNMYVDHLVTRPVEVEGGCYRVPETPGLGIEFDEAALKYRVDSPTCPPLDAFNDKAIYAVVRPSGEKTWYNGEMTSGGYRQEALDGNVPLFERGVSLETWHNDGSKDWKQLAERVKVAPVAARSV